MDATVKALTDEVAELRGHLLALEAVVNALVLRLPNDAAQVLDALHATESFSYSRALASSGASPTTSASFDRQSRRIHDLIDRSERPDPMEGVVSDFGDM